MRFFKKNKGAAMVSVLIAITFIGILSTSLMFMAYMNYLTKATRHKSTDNFYTAEFALDELATSLQQIAANAPDIATAKTDMAAAIDPNGDGQWHDNAGTIVTTLMPHASKDALLALTCTVSGNEYSTSGQFEMNGVQVKATGIPGTSRDGYESTIGTDLSVNFSTASGGPLDIYDFSLICDAPYNGSGGDTFFNGCVYLQGVSGNAVYPHQDALIVEDGMTAFLGKRNIINGDVTVKKGGVLNVVGDFQVNGKITVEAGGAVIGSGDFHVRDGITGSSTYYVQDGINRSADSSLHWEKLPDNTIPGGTSETSTYVPGRYRQVLFRADPSPFHNYPSAGGGSFILVEFNEGAAAYQIENPSNWASISCNIVPGGIYAEGSTEYNGYVIKRTWWNDYQQITDAPVPAVAGHWEVTSAGAQGLTTMLFAKTIPIRLQNGSGWVSLGKMSDATVFNNMAKLPGTPGGYIVNGSGGTTYTSKDYTDKFGGKAENLLLMNYCTKPMTLKGTFFNSTMLSEVAVDRDDRSLPVYLQKMDKKIYDKILDSYYVEYVNGSGSGLANNWASAPYFSLDASGNLGAARAVNMGSEAPLFPSSALASLTASNTLTYKDPNSDVPGHPAKERTAEATSTNVNMLKMKNFLVDDTAGAIGRVFNCLGDDPDNDESQISYQDWYKL